MGDSTSDNAGDLPGDDERWIGRALLSLVFLGIVGAIGWWALGGADRWPVPDEVALPAFEPGPAGAGTTDEGDDDASPTTVTAPDWTPLPAGSTCRQLKTAGATYADVVRYWNATGQPDSLDEDGNGAPCETVYPARDVRNQLGDPSGTTSVSTTTTRPGDRDNDDLPPGLNCGQLNARGVPVGEALDYYVAEGSPGRMDADDNGVPCETVYSDAARVWRSRR